MSLVRRFLWGDASESRELDRRLSELRGADDPRLRQWGGVLRERLERAINRDANPDD
jgi:hypothetical protein